MPDTNDSAPEISETDATAAPGPEETEIVPVDSPSFDMTAALTATQELLPTPADPRDDFDPRADRATPTETAEGDPTFDRLAALAQSTGTDPRELVAAGQAIEDANGDLSPDQVLTVMEVVKASGGELPGAATLKVTHGSYAGPGCPDMAARTGADKGWPYDKAHAAKPGELVVGLSPAEARRLLATKCFAAVK